MQHIGVWSEKLKKTKYKSSQGVSHSRLWLQPGQVYRLEIGDSVPCAVAGGCLDVPAVFAPTPLNKVEVFEVCNRSLIAQNHLNFLNCSCRRKVQFFLQ